MPIYAYKCGSCGHAKDVLQKFSDTPLTTCPACGAEAFSKQVTAAAFQLKGSGYYVTDFRDGNKAAAPADDQSGDAKPADKPSDKPADTTAAKPAESKPAESKPAQSKPSESKPSGGAAKAGTPPAAGGL
jgi:putative FmdB family regulatory protein